MTPSFRASPIIVAGMHRSGTSYLASVLGSLGVNLGPKLVGAQRGNPRGHFEDVAILDFHQRALSSRHNPQRTLYDDGTLVQYPLDAAFSAAEAAEASSLLATRETDGPWGWKEPRTSLFLRAWLKIAPQASVVAISRHPLEVHFSMLRRGTWESVMWPDHIVRSWSLHQAAIATAETSGDHPFLWLTSALDFKDPKALRAKLAQNLDLSGEAVTEVEFATKEFRQLKLSEAVMESFAMTCPVAHAWWQYVVAKREGKTAPLPPRAFDELNLSQEGDLRKIEATVARDNKIDLDELHNAHRDELVNRLRNTEKWNREAEAIHQSNEFLNAELEKIGAAFTREQAFCESQTKKLAQTFEELRKVGKSWEAQRDHIQALHREREHLKAALSRAETTSSS